jgi:4-hydroxy-tetrahydrodipicolinate synthase
MFGRVITAMITPFNDNGEVNYKEAARIAEYLAKNGSDGIFGCRNNGRIP